ncbi:NUDIX hydrolase [Paenibacillus beijingensis]|uniref:NUDIX hydrolase n=1 Tax=Paenibacillus beijingensis TaxID=1126833 RepID=A0A0D5NH50_9BACL|nr:NUDIX domain-containing protein [Paenibacillus beijingensis]AJY74465.1 NUDIX hydrolase [Paenibacillus beijingensis]
MGTEFFDIYDEEWKPAGIASRADVHAHGWRHMTFHCWVTRREGGRHYVWFQLRQSSKDTFPDCFDITAAGHLAAGETVRDALRELKEELGIDAAFESLLPLGSHDEVTAGTAGGVPFIDHERSHEFALPVDVPLSSLKLQHEEVAGVYEAELAAVIDLFEGRRSEIIARGVESTASGELLPAKRTVTADRFVPRDGGYYAELFRTIRRLT